MAVAMTEQRLQLQDGTTKSNLSTERYDIICVGFGPAALAIAIAMRERGVQKRVLFVEKQPQFGWHTGMLLPGSKMQISFLKDLATMRNPKSHFSFLNYLRQHDRLVPFINLSTLTPLREEFNDYMRWCASHFNDWVQYNQQVVSVTTGEKAPAAGHHAVESFQVTLRDVRSGDIRRLSAKDVIVATGGEKAIPKELSQPQLQDYLIHSSEYLNTISQKLKEENPVVPYRFAIVGGGQSAVEILQDLQSRYPKSQTTLIFRDSALRPSDDSPFVNEIFDPSSVDEFFSLSPSVREERLQQNKATNYSVVRLPLLEDLYEKLYRQKLLQPDPSQWTLRLVNNREICGAEILTSSPSSSSSQPAPRNRRSRLQLRLLNTQTGKTETTKDAFDAVILATGYNRDPFSGILRHLRPLLLSTPETEEAYHVQRNYRVLFQPGTVRRNAGIWLQGCCESTHGISDSLLSILAIRADELLDSILASRRSAGEQARL